MEDPTRPGTWRPLEGPRPGPEVRPEPVAGPSLTAARVAGPDVEAPPGPSSADRAALADSLSAPEEAAPTALLRGLTEAAPPASAAKLFTRQSMVGLITVGGLLAGCAVGALALGATGLLMTAAVEVMAFAGGMWLSQSTQQQLEEANRKLQYEATHDPLTGLKNRGAVLGILEEALGQWGGRRRHVAVVLADVDHFKSINDTWGHPAGDAVLQEVARRLSGALRTEDNVGRYGGEEVLVVLPGLALDEAVRAAERLRLELASRPIHTAEASLTVTASFGVASSAELESASTADLIRLADQALYRAKSRGRNRVEAADPTLDR